LISAIYSFYCPDCSEVIARRLNFNTYITRSLSVLLIKSELLTKCSSFSNDSDIKNYQSDLIKQKILSEYVDEVLLLIKNRDKLNNIKQAFLAQKKSLCKEIIDFLKHDWMEDELVYYNDVNNMKIHSIEVKSSHLELDNDYKLLLFENDDSGFLESKAILNYEVIVEVDEQGSCWYDDETGEYNYREREHREIKRRFEFVAGVNFNFNKRGDVLMSFDDIVSQFL
ncbi:MAG: hypothetical protein L3J29_12860, partial [Cyclobacteriaceae bacterium]|nr:hypothetical protein [Cyclobacteriaceae bacterium]